LSDVHVYQRFLAPRTIHGRLGFECFTPHVMEHGWPFVAQYYVLKAQSCTSPTLGVVY
jgi:hypothetical protein